MSFSILPRLVYKTHSKISGEIKIEELLGVYTLHVQGLIQSGGIVKGIWKKPIKNVQMLKYSNAQRCLVLGLGGGTVVQLIKVYFPKAKIVGVEIDPEIIKIAKKYFGLGKVSDLEIVNADAFDYVKKARGVFDLIIVDLYLGNKFPHQAEQSKFLVQIKKLLEPQGVVVINRLKSKKNNLEFFENKLKNNFSRVNLVKSATNLFFLVS